MIARPADAYKVVGLDGSPRCRFCGEADPTPDQIATRTARIRAGWTRREERNRRFGTQAMAELLGEWTPPAVDDRL